MEVYFALEAIKMDIGNKETFQFPIWFLSGIIINLKTEDKDLQGPLDKRDEKQATGG